ncbi:MAG: hypothetical protein ACRD1H_20375 [Vicinamibacterales bacterium]
MIWWRALLFVPLVLAARIRGIERRALTRSRDAGANTAERAILMDREGLLASFVHRRLERAGVLQPAANDRYYVNERAYRAFQTRRRRRALVMTIVLGSLAATYFGGCFS